MYANSRGSGGWEEPGDSHPERIGHYFLGLLLLRGIVFWQEILARNITVRARRRRERSRRTKNPEELLCRAGSAGPPEVSFASGTAAAELPRSPGTP